jgi:hypothetical protein
MKNSKVHTVWMLIIKKRKSYKQVYTFCMNKYKQNEKELQNTLKIEDSKRVIRSRKSKMNRQHNENSQRTNKDP